MLISLLQLTFFTTAKDRQNKCDVDFGQIIGFFNNVWEANACILKEVSRDIYRANSAFFHWPDHRILQQCLGGQGLHTQGGKQRHL